MKINLKKKNGINHKIFASTVVLHPFRTIEEVLLNLALMNALVARFQRIFSRNLNLGWKRLLLRSHQLKS
jgi:hypothetical protein